MSKPSLYTVVDLAERAGATFAQAFLASVTLGHSVVPAISDLVALKLAAVAGAYAVAKYLLVKASAFLGTSASPAAPK